MKLERYVSNCELSHFVTSSLNKHVLGVHSIRVRDGGEGVCRSAPHVRKLCDFSGKTLMIRATTFVRDNYKKKLLT